MKANQKMLKEISGINHCMNLMKEGKNRKDMKCSETGGKDMKGHYVG